MLGEFYGSLDERRMSVITTTDKMALAQGAMDSMIAKSTYSLVLNRATYAYIAATVLMLLSIIWSM